MASLLENELFRCLLASRSERAVQSAIGGQYQCDRIPWAAAISPNYGQNAQRFILCYDTNDISVVSTPVDENKTHIEGVLSRFLLQNLP